jgi:hypothetical protein
VLVEAIATIVVRPKGGFSDVINIAIELLYQVAGNFDFPLSDNISKQDGGMTVIVRIA